MAANISVPPAYCRGTPKRRVSGSDCPVRSTFAFPTGETLTCNKPDVVLLRGRLLATFISPLIDIPVGVGRSFFI